MPAQPEALGLTPAKLKYLDNYLRTRYVDSGKMPCAVTLIARRGEVAHLSAIGRMDIERDKPVREDTIFRIYSMTKPITSVALMMLVEEGKIALDDPVHRHIPAWRDLSVYVSGFMETFRSKPPQRPMLVVDLFRHTSGLTYGFQQRTNVDAAYRKLNIGELQRVGTLESMIEGLSKLPLEFSPGTAWNYSVSTDVLGYLVGKISGMPFEQFLKTRIFQPLGMVDTDFYVPADKQSRFGACYNFVPNGGMQLQDDPQKSPYLKPPTYVSGGGGLVSTAADYLRFCRMLLNGGSVDGVRLLSPKTIELMTLNHLPDGKDLFDLSVSAYSEIASPGFGFGLGFSVMINQARALLPGSTGDFAWGGAASTYFWIDPREELITIFLTQLLPSRAYPVRRELRTLVYSALAESNAPAHR